ncbi:MAG: hypothetical protein GWN61_23510, partial [candidate division Zixibacteria bacterium]|nr:hypothetical protein [candidate division Zixibacteria bacterium]NIS48827.1 hypothetical protein [candidate division Zixibacteria bacterium]NIU16908.1 hypothetical protein [candidate division Zixibacteria bacterium]NIV09060.1 hypothetical protein [candidate division Zixibacteria bacterium]NIX59352.1 hypothetical protein [candidate division Zixibacteria bacterium]
MPAPAVTTLTDLANEINLSTAVTGVVAHVGNDGEMYLYNSDYSSSPISIQEDMIGASDGDDDELQGYFGSTLTGTTNPTNSFLLEPAPSDYYIVTDKNGAIVTEGAYSENNQIVFKGGSTSIKGEPFGSDRFQVYASEPQDIFTAIQNAIRALEQPSGDAEDMSRINNQIT